MFLVAKIYDVSAVSIPANDGTEISARDYFKGVIKELGARDNALATHRKNYKN